MSLVFSLKVAPIFVGFGMSRNDTGNASGLVVTATTLTLQRVETSASVEFRAAAVFLGARTYIALSGHLLFSVAFILVSFQPLSAGIAVVTVFSSFFSRRPR